MAYKRVNEKPASVDIYYRFKAANPPHDKVKVWEAGMPLEGRFQGEIVRGEFTDYLLLAADGSSFTVPKTSGLERDLASLEKDTQVRLTFVEKIKLKGGKTFRVIDVEADDSDENTPL